MAASGGALQHGTGQAGQGEANADAAMKAVPGRQPARAARRGALHRRRRALGTRIAALYYYCMPAGPSCAQRTGGGCWAGGRTLWASGCPSSSGAGLQANPSAVCPRRALLPVPSARKRSCGFSSGQARRAARALIGPGVVVPLSSLQQVATPGKPSTSRNMAWEPSAAARSRRRSFTPPWPPVRPRGHPPAVRTRPPSTAVQRSAHSSSASRLPASPKPPCTCACAARTAQSRRARLYRPVQTLPLLPNSTTSSTARSAGPARRLTTWAPRQGAAGPAAPPPLLQARRTTARVDVPGCSIACESTHSPAPRPYIARRRRAVLLPGRLPHGSPGHGAGALVCVASQRWLHAGGPVPDNVQLARRRAGAAPADSQTTVQAAELQHAGVGAPSGVSMRLKRASSSC